LGAKSFLPRKMVKIAVRAFFLENALFYSENRCKNGEDFFFGEMHFFGQNLEKITSFGSKIAI